MNTELSGDNISEIAYAFQESRILLTAFELGIFTELGDLKRSSGDVSKALGTNPRATDRLMNALCAIGFLQKDGGLFSNAPHSASLLVAGKDDFMSGLMHTVNMWNTWGTLTDAVRKGTSTAGKSPWGRDDKWVEAFIEAMHYRAVRQATEVVKLIDTANVRSLLDVGAGSGAYSMAFIKSNDRVRATLFDLPNVIALTKRYIERGGCLKRVEFVSGDYTKDDLMSGFDLVFLSQILHSNPLDQNARLIKKAANALNPGGKVVVQEFIVDEDRTSPPFAAMFSLNMLVATEEGDTYTENEVRGWMQKAGLSDIVRKDTDVGTALIIGKK